MTDVEEREKEYTGKVEWSRKNIKSFAREEYRLE